MFLVNGKINEKPIASVAKPGIINNTAAKAIAAPDNLKNWSFVST